MDLIILALNFQNSKFKPSKSIKSKGKRYIICKERTAKQKGDKPTQLKGHKQSPCLNFMPNGFTQIIPL